MSLAIFLLAKAISDTVYVSRNVAAVAQTAAAAADIASSVATIKGEKRARAEAIKAQQAPLQNQVEYSYDVDLFLAKVAMLSYIAKADRMISSAERMELEQSLSVANNMFGYEVTAKARQIFEKEGHSFTALEPYLRKVQDEDLDSFVFYSEEYANTDNELTSEEKSALQKLKAYIDSRRGKKNFENLLCPNCGGAMHADSYGYKAACNFCGYETVLNIDNSPSNFITYPKCTSCGSTFKQFKDSKNFAFCTYCGGRVVSVTERIKGNKKEGNSNKTDSNRSKNNLYITYNSINSDVGMVTRIVSTGMMNRYNCGQTLAFCLAQGKQTIILKIGRKNYSRDVFIHPSNSPVRIYASYNGRGQITIDQPSC